MRHLRPVFARRSAYLTFLGITVAIVAMTTSTTFAVNTAKLLPSGLRPVETDLGAAAGLSDLVFGESQVVVNPTNPDNVVYTSLTHLLTPACEDSGAPECQQVNRVIRDGPVALPIGPGPRGFFTVSGFSHNTLFVSFNKGNSWQAVVLPCCPPDHPEMDTQGDPSVTVGPDGTFYAVWDSINWGDDPNSALPNGGVTASKSTDGGLTWSTPVLTQTAMDGPKVVADPNTGRVYAHSTGAIGTRTATGNPADPLFVGAPTPSDRYVAASSDGVSWSTPKRFGGGSFAAGGGLTAAHGVIATAARFTTSTACDFFVAGTTAPCVIFSTSTDDGQTWTRNVVNAPDLTPPAGLEPGAGGILVAADPTTPGHFSAAGFRPLASGGGISVYQTTDSGVTWTGPTVVNDGNPYDKARSALAYSLDGTLGLMWRAYTEAPSGGQIAAPFTVWAAVSTDGGATFANPLRLGGVSPKPPRPGFHNNADHYSSIGFGEDRLYVSWADSRTVDRAAFIGEVKLDAFFHPFNQ
jgi:hypothetical protein